MRTKDVSRTLIAYAQFAGVGRWKNFIGFPPFSNKGAERRSTQD